MPLGCGVLWGAGALRLYRVGQWVVWSVGPHCLCSCRAPCPSFLRMPCRAALSVLHAIPGAFWGEAPCVGLGSTPPPLGPRLSAAVAVVSWVAVSCGMGIICQRRYFPSCPAAVALSPAPVTAVFVLVGDVSSHGSLHVPHDSFDPRPALHNFSAATPAALALMPRWGSSLKGKPAKDSALALLTSFAARAVGQSTLQWYAEPLASLPLEPFQSPSSKAIPVIIDHGRVCLGPLLPACRFLASNSFQQLAI